jgi:hypothetical protein
MQPANTIRDIFNAANPVPLQGDDPRYVDCTEVRGGQDAVSELFSRIDLSDRVLTQLFTGHRGCGKSTELLRLKRRLEAANYAVIYFEADEVIDIDDVEYSDILVALARQVYEGFRSMGLSLQKELLDDIFNWFAEVVSEFETVKAAEATLSAELSIQTPPLPLLSRLMARITGQLRTGVESKKNVRLRLDPQIAQLIDRINLLIRSGRAALRQDGKQGPVIIIDNLDKVPFRMLDDDRRNSHDAIYIEHGEQLRALDCHLIYTVPIAMMYSPRATVLTNIFSDYLVLPMLKTHTREDKAWEPGVRALREILAKRIDLDVAFDEETIQLLCKESGGHPRQLITLIRNASLFANRQEQTQPLIERRAVERALERLVSEYSRSIPEDHFPLLAQIHLDKQVANDEANRLMLHNLSVLEYLNGSPPWHDVNPAVLHLAKFQEALAHERQTREKEE